MRNAANKIGKDSILWDDDDNRYVDPTLLRGERLYFNKNARTPTVVHELQHALNHNYGSSWFNDIPQDEAVAQAAQEFVSALPHLQKIEEILADAEKSGAASHSRDDIVNTIQVKWGVAWGGSGLFPHFGDTKVGVTNSKIGILPIIRFKLVSGINLSCDSLAEEYTKTSGSNALCIKFACDPTRTASSFEGTGGRFPVRVINIPESTYYMMQLKVPYAR